MNKIKQSISNYKYPILFFSLFSIIAAFPILLSFSNWGQLDWDQHTFYHAVPERTILSFLQFPLWNPYHCGGTAVLANPQSTFLSPFFILVLLFGEIYGLKLQIFLALFIGMLGMYFTSKQLGYSKYSSFLPSIIFFLSSWFALRTNVGHTIYFMMSFFPWIFYFYLKSLENIKYIFPAALFIAFLIFGGAVYPIVFIALVLGLYSLFTSIQSKSFKPLIIAVIILLSFFLIAAIKLFPLMEFTERYASVQQDTQYHSVNLLIKSLLDRSQKELLLGKTFMPRDIPFEEVIIRRVGGELPWAWHEYGNYIGIIPLIFLIASLYWLRKLWPLILSAIILLIISLGDASVINIWSIIHKLPFLASIHGPSRFIIAFTLFASLIIGYVCSRIEEKQKLSIVGKQIKASTVIIVLIIIITLDLLLVSWPLYANTFDIKPPDIKESKDKEIIPIWSSNPLISQYPNFLQNLATIDCYERVHPSIKAVPAFIDTGEKYAHYYGEAYIAENNQTQSLVYFSPNKIKVKVNIKREQTLVLNQNYDSGWKAKDREVFSYNGLIAAKVKSSDSIAEFYYLPNSFLIGLVVTIISLIGGVYFYVK